jgi:hypothetical protein
VITGERRRTFGRPAEAIAEPGPIIEQVAMAAAIVVTLVTGADYLARAARLYRSPAPPGS